MNVKKININQSETSYYIASDNGYLYAGVATPTTNPGTPDVPVFYIAGEGTYTNFSEISVDKGELAVLKWNGSWSKQSLKVGLPPNELNISYSSLHNFIDKFSTIMYNFTGYNCANRAARRTRDEGPETPDLLREPASGGQQRSGQAGEK